MFKKWIKNITGLQDIHDQATRLKNLAEETHKQYLEEQNKIKSLQEEYESLQSNLEEANRELEDKTLSPKEIATRDGKPWVSVIDTQVNPNNIRNGFFELDWNNEFIEQLLDAGYRGESQEEIVNSWFRTLIYQMLDEEGQNPYINTPEVGYINIVPRKDGKSEVS